MKKKIVLSTTSRLVIYVIIITAIFTIPIIKDFHFERTRYMKSDFTNIYEFDFIDHWNQVADELQLNEEIIKNAKIENLRIEYEKSGEITTLRYEVVWNIEQGLCHASVFFNEATKKYEICAHKIKEWLQYDRMILTERVFDLLDKINIPDLFIEMNTNHSTPNEEFEYYGLALGERGNLGFQDSNIFVLEEPKIIPFTGRLPVEASYIKTYASLQSDETISENIQGDYFLFDMILTD